MTAFTQGYPLWLVDGEMVRLVVGWEQAEGDRYRPITISLGGPTCLAETELADELRVYPDENMALRAASRSAE